MNRSTLLRFLFFTAAIVLAVLPLSMDFEHSKITVAEATCQDCRPAPERWACMGVEKSCNLKYEICENLPFPDPS